MDILLVTDHNFIMPTVIAMKSVCISNPKEYITFHVIIDETVNKVDVDSIKKINESNEGKVSLKLYPINSGGIDLNIFPQIGKTHHSKATYYRILVCNILPPELKKVLYIDSDVIVRKNISELWNIDIEGYAVACVPDANEDNREILKRLNIDYKLGYFNAGIAYINLEYWRLNNIQNRLLTFIKEKSDLIKFVDQDVLNAVLKSEKKFLPLKYNVQTGFLLKPKYLKIDLKKYKDQLTEAVSDPYIIHFIGPKPWSPDCHNPYKVYFKNVQDMTEWKDVRMVKGEKYVKAVIRKYLREILICLGLYENKLIDVKLNDNR